MVKQFLFMILFITPGFELMAQKPEIFSTEGNALNGYDVVSFHKDGQAQIGSAAFTTTWKEAKWLFVSQAHLDSFLVDPKRYAPQYGGYCAYGMAGGYKAPTMIDTWTIVDGKLYFNYNQQVKDKWNGNKIRLIGKADQNWAKVKSK